MQDGFERVSIERIAAAAEVAPKTVYNYFPTKAALVFDESDTIRDDLVNAVRNRRRGESALDAVRRLLAEFPQRVGDARPVGPSTAFRRLIDQSATLRTRRREMFTEFERALTAALSVATGSQPNEIEPFIAAAAIVTVFRARFELAPTETKPDAVQRQLAQRTKQALDLLDRGLHNYAVAD